MNKIKDVAGLLKAKITKDDLQQALINATSQQNWQTSTHILHEIANAAYNYEKCQQINEFIWDKLKKSKSWRKILKSLNLVEFLLKNGPSSMITSYKYDVYQFRSFDSYSHYDDSGVDRGTSIREKAKLVVDLLSNEELLEEQRLKAKTIRQKMSGVVSGSTYGGFNANQSGAKYGNIDKKSYSTGGYSNGNYGPGGYDSGSLGTYGDYTYNKSTLDKYKDNNTSVKPATNNLNKAPISVNTSEKQFKKDPVLNNKKPFERIAPKLVKPGSKPVAKVESVNNNNNTVTNTANNNNGDLFDDILGGSQPVVEQPKPSISQPPVQKSVQQTFTFDSTPQVVPNNNNSYNNGFHNQVQPQNNNHTLMYGQMPQHTQIPPIQANNFNNANILGGYGQPMNNQGYGQGQNLYSQNTYGQNNGFDQNFPAQNSANMTNTNMNSFGLGFANNSFQQSPGYNQPQTYSISQQQSWSKPSNNNNQLGSLNTGISLSTTASQNKKKEQDEFGNFSSGQSNNVKWLSNEEKGLIDFSDFGEELNKKPNSNVMRNNSNKNANNNIDMTWNW